MTNDAERNVRTIRDTNGLIRALVEQDTLEFPRWVGGIVRRANVSDRGHLYFDLQDDDYSIPCFVHQNIVNGLSFSITSGMELDVFGVVRVYEPQARVQVDVEKVVLIERPAFTIDVSAKERLMQKGLWPPPRRTLPPVVRSITLITSQRSQALSDFRENYLHEGGQAKLNYVYVPLQGQEAPQEIADAIQGVSEAGQTDVIAIVRGGGRNRDLGVFNDYLIAEAICRSAIPVVTGIGHQQDSTFADQVADYSKGTPTAAAYFLAKHGKEMPSTPSLQSPESKAPASGSRMLTLLVAFFVIVAIVGAAVALLIGLQQ
jgi:exodeoxyribonuclease VII large subunit